MDRMSVASSSSSASAGGNDWKAIYGHFLNIHHAAPNREEIAKKWIKSLKMVGFKSGDHVVQYVKQKSVENTTKNFANRSLWNKLNAIANQVPNGVSKSMLVDKVVEYANTFKKQGNAPAEVIDIDDDDDDSPSTSQSSAYQNTQIVQTPNDSIGELLQQNLISHIENKLLRIFPGANHIQIADVRRSIVRIIDNVGFNGINLVPLYVCDYRKCQSRDPRGGAKQSRIKELLKFYFKSNELSLPSNFTLEILAETLIEFCKANQNHVQVTPQHFSNYEEAMQKFERVHPQIQRPPEPQQIQQISRGFPQQQPPRPQFPRPTPASPQFSQHVSSVPATQQLTGSSQYSRINTQTTSGGVDTSRNQPRNNKPIEPLYGNDPMMHKMDNHFLRSSSTLNEDETLKIYFYMKYIGDCITSDQCLQIGFLSEDDEEKPKFIAVDPQAVVKPDLKSKLRYETKTNGQVAYSHAERGAVKAYEMKKALGKFLDYTDQELTKSRMKYATIVVFHAEHLIQLINDLVPTDMADLKKDFLSLFRGYTIIEEEIRKQNGIREDVRLTVDDGYEHVFKQPPRTDSLSESDVKAKRIKEVVGGMSTTKQQRFDDKLLVAAGNYFRNIIELGDLRAMIEKKLKKERVRLSRREGIFGKFPNHFHKEKLRSFEDTPKAIASRFIELLVSVEYQNMAWNKSILKSYCSQYGQNNLFKTIQTSIETSTKSNLRDTETHEVLVSCISEVVNFAAIKDEPRYKSESASDVSISPEYSANSRGPRRDSRPRRSRSRSRESRISNRRRSRSRSRESRVSSRRRSRSRESRVSSRRSRSRSPSRRRTPPRRPRTPPRRKSPPRRKESRDVSRKRSRSPMAKNRGDSKELDGRSLGFGNTRNLTTDQLEFWLHTRKKFENVMDGVIAFCELEKENDAIYNETNTHKLVLDLLLFLKRQNKQLEDIIEKSKDKKALDKMSTELFGSNNKSTSQFTLMRSLFYKAAHYAQHKYEPSDNEKPIVYDMSEKEAKERLKLFLDFLYANYIKKRKSPPEYFDIHEAIFFSPHIRKSKDLTMDIEQLANDFIAFLREEEIPPSELKKNRLANLRLPLRLETLKRPLGSALHEYYIHLDNATRFCPKVSKVEFKIDEANGLYEFADFFGKCILEEIFLMIVNKDVENLNFSDVNLEKLTLVLSNITDQLINNNFTIFNAIHHFNDGTLNQYLNNVIQAEAFEDKDLITKIISVWIGNLVKRRLEMGPPLSLIMKNLLEKKAYVLVKSWTIIEKEVAIKLQWNRSFPPNVEHEVVKIIHSKSRDIKVEMDEECFTGLSLDEKDRLPTPDWKMDQIDPSKEKFIDFPGNVINVEEVKIAAKARIQIRASLCGVPRIKPLARMNIWVDKDFQNEQNCQVHADDHRLICNNRLTLNIINVSDNDVILPAFTVIAQTQVHENNENNVKSQLLKPAETLFFLMHYYDVCKMQNIEEDENGGYVFKNGHQVRINKRSKVNFKITFSDLLKEPKGELYRMEEVVFFLKNFNGDFKEYLQKCLDSRVPIIAHRDHFNLIALFQGKIPKCFQMQSRTKLAEMDINDLGEDEFGNEDMKELDLIKKYQTPYPIDDIIQTLKEQSSIPLEMAQNRVRDYLFMLEKMKYPLSQKVWDCHKSGRLRDLFEDTIAYEIAKFYKSNPNMYEECDLLKNGETLKIDNMRDIKTENGVGGALAFLKLFENDMNGLREIKNILNELNEKLKKAKKGRESAQDEEAKAKYAKEIKERLKKVPNLVGTKLIEATKLIKDHLNTQFDGTKHEMGKKLTLFVASDNLSASYILLEPPGDKITEGKIIAMGSRLFASCEKLCLDIIKDKKAINFALEECENIVRKSELDILVDNFDVQELFSDKIRYEQDYDPILNQLCAKHEFIVNTDGNPAGFLLISRSKKPQKEYSDKYSRLYALKDTTKAVLSILVTKKKKEKYAERATKLEETSDGGVQIVTKKSEYGIFEVINAWNTSKELLPFIGLINSIKRSLIVDGDDPIYAKCRANDLALRLHQAGLTVEKLSKCVQEDLDNMIGKVKMPKDFQKDEVISLILDHFCPIEPVIDLNMEVEDEDSKEDENQNLTQFFAELEKGETDSRKLNHRIVEQKKLMIPMKKYFEMKKVESKQAAELVNTWIKNGRNLEDLRKTYEKNVMKGRSTILKKYHDFSGGNETLAKLTYEFFKNNAHLVNSKTNLNHNDFRRKHLMKLQSETILRTSYAPLQHFYEILHKFHKKDEEAPQKAQKYIEVWMLLGFRYEDVVALFLAGVHLPQCLDDIFAKLRNLLDVASCFNLKDIDSKVLLEYTAMYFKAKAMLVDSSSVQDDSSMDYEDPQNDKNWNDVKENVLNLLGDNRSADFDNLKSILSTKFTASTLNYIMKSISKMVGGRAHVNAFTCAVQANLLRDHCDRPLHMILKDSLNFFATANFCTVGNVEEMDESDDREDGECMTDTGNETDVSIKSITKKDAILKLPKLTKLNLEELKNQDLNQTEVEMEILDISKLDYFYASRYLWLNSKKRVYLEQEIEFNGKKFECEEIMRVFEFRNLQHAEYSREMVKNFPQVPIVQKEDFESLVQVFNESFKLKVQELSTEKMLQLHLETCLQMSGDKTENPPIFSSVSRPFQRLAQKYFGLIYSKGLQCQKNWAEVSSLIAEENIDCWLIPNFTFDDLLNPLKNLVQENDKKVICSRKKIREFYENLIDGLIDHADAMPPAMKLYSFTKETVLILEDLCVHE